MSRLTGKLRRQIMAFVLSAAMVMPNMTIYANEISALESQTEVNSSDNETDETPLPFTEDDTAQETGDVQDETTQAGLTSDDESEEADSPEDGEASQESGASDKDDASQKEQEDDETDEGQSDVEAEEDDAEYETDVSDEEAIEEASLEKSVEVAPVSITESKGWHESAYVKWSPLEGIDRYNVYYKNSGTENFVKIDNSLIRKYENYYIADALGLAKGDYIIKVVPVSEGKEIEDAKAETGTLSVDNYVREGFAFSPKSPYGYTTGAYNKDGTLKSDADVIYVTNANKETVTVNGDTSLGVGLTAILSQREKSKSEKPIAIRILGKVEMPKGTVNYMIAVQNTKNVTIEGVGDDAVVHGCGFTMKRACNIEVRNLAIMWYGGGGDGDSLSFDTENKNIFVHNVDFFYGHGKDADQAKGDGSIDLKAKSDYVTVSYCHFWDSGKALVLGGPWEVSNYEKDEAKIFATYHHNWFDHSDSRHPRCVAGSAHVYNNYYDGVAKYGPGAAVNASVFVENNYFRNCPRPMLIATQGSDNWDSESGTYKDKGTLSGQAE